MTLRDSVDRTLSEAGLSSEQEKTYTDAYSAFGTVTAVGEHGSASLFATGVGGDFFVFHPLRLLSGGYISERDLMKDRVVLDELAAWQLFGGTDVAGLFIQINGTRYYVAGVVERDDDYASRRAEDERPGIYLSYEALNGISDTPITSYEIVLPEPVQNFGAELLRERFAAGSSDEVIEQSDRYSFSRLWNTFWSMGERVMGGYGISYPRWEKAIRLTEFHLSLLLIAMLAFSAAPAVTISVIAVKLISKAVKTGKQRLPVFVERLVEERKEKKYLQKEGERLCRESP